MRFLGLDITYEGLRIPYTNIRLPIKPLLELFAFTQTASKTNGINQLDTAQAKTLCSLPAGSYQETCHALMLQFPPGTTTEPCQLLTACDNGEGRRFHTRKFLSPGSVPSDMTNRHGKLQVDGKPLSESYDSWFIWRPDPQKSNKTKMYLHYAKVECEEDDEIQLQASMTYNAPYEYDGLFMDEYSDCILINPECLAPGRQSK